MKRSITSHASEIDDLIDVEQAATLLKVETKTIYRWAASWLPHYKLGSRCLRFSKREIYQALRRKRVIGLGEESN